MNAFEKGKRLSIYTYTIHYPPDENFYVSISIKHYTKQVKSKHYSAYIYLMKKVNYMKTLLKTLLLLLSVSCILLLVSCGDDDDDDDVTTPITVTANNFSVTVDENPAAGQVLGTVNASTNMGSLTFSLSNENPAGALNINPGSGQLTVADETLFDFEVNPQITAGYDAVNGDVTETASITITLNDVDEGGSSTPAFEYNGVTLEMLNGIIFEDGPSPLLPPGPNTHFSQNYVISDGDISGSGENAQFTNNSYLLDLFLLTPGTSEFQLGTFDFILDGGDEDFLFDAILFDGGTDILAIGGEITVSGSMDDPTVEFSIELEDGNTITGTYSDGFEFVDLYEFLQVFDENSVIWDGPGITFTKADGVDPTMEANQDRITGNVWITRGNQQGIYNAATEEGYEDFFSPEGTLWAFGTTENAADLRFDPWEITVFSSPPDMVGQPMVLYLEEDNIFIDITFTDWAIGKEGGMGGFSYERSTAP